VRELRPGLWHWKARHPAWTPDQGGETGWEGDVSCYAVRATDTLVLIDPISTPEVERLAREGEGGVVVLLTAHWHQRSARELNERFGAAVHVPADEDRPDAPSQPFEVGDTLPGGVEARPGFYPGAAALWLPEHRALVTGDVLVGDGEGGVRILDAWMPEGESVQTAASALRPLLDLPVELVLPTHGEPVVERAHEALRQALAP
jgi:glyoxylase-like metal-dependent hydrolase (beta-lactamase superfamily II)